MMPNRNGLDTGGMPVADYVCSSWGWMPRFTCAVAFPGKTRLASSEVHADLSKHND